MLFDLNHQLAGLRGTKTEAETSPLGLEWQTKLATLSIYDEDIIKDTTLYGWLLYFAIRFDRLDKTGNRVSPDHLLLVSSAIAGDKGPSADAMTQFLRVQLSAWTQFATKPELLKSRRMTDFSFAPLPKVTTAGDPRESLLQTGLKIFNNTYKDAANWEVTRTLLLEDMMLLWVEAQEGHHSHSNFDKVKDRLKCYRWVEPLIPEDNGLRGVHHCSKASEIAQHKEHLTVKSLVDFLKMASPVCCAGVQLPTECEDWRLRVFTNPCLSALIGIGDLICELSRLEGYNDRVLPVVSLEKAPDDVGLAVIVKVTTPAAMILETVAKGNYGGSSGTACEAMERLVHGSSVVLHHLSRHDEGAKVLKARRTDNGKSRRCHLNTHCYSSLWGTHFIRRDDAICAVFYKTH